MDAAFIQTVLRNLHPRSEWIFLSEVRTCRGFSQQFRPRRSGPGGRAKLLEQHPAADLDTERYIDAFALHRWQAQGFHRIAYEIKCSRQDWLNELADPAKRCFAYYHSHEHWFALAHGIYHDNDIESWADGSGVMLIHEDGSYTLRRPARRREALHLPEAFLISLLVKALEEPLSTEIAPLPRQNRPVTALSPGRSPFIDGGLFPPNADE